VSGAKGCVCLRRWLRPKHQPYSRSFCIHIHHSIHLFLSLHPSISIILSGSLSANLSTSLSRTHDRSVQISHSIPYIQPCKRTCWFSAMRMDRAMQKQAPSCSVVLGVHPLVLRYPWPPP